MGKRRRIRRLLWAELLKRTFGVDPKQCPDCGGRMKMIATIMRADVVKAERSGGGALILDAQGLPTPGALHPAVPRPTQRRAVRGLVDVTTSDGTTTKDSAGPRVNRVG